MGSPCEQRHVAHRAPGPRALPSAGRDPPLTAPRPSPSTRGRGRPGQPETTVPAWSFDWKRSVRTTRIVGSAEISAITLALFVFASLPLVNLRREHIIVDLFNFSSGSIPERATRGLATAVTAACTLWVAFEVSQLALDLARHGDTTSFLHIPYAPVAIFMALACLVAGLFSLGDAAPLDEETALGLDDDTDGTDRADGVDGTATRRSRATE